MSTENSLVFELIDTLKKCQKSDEYIIEVLSSIIQTKLMYGGDIREAVIFQIYKARDHKYII